ncbi:putative ankyrin repeat protein [Chloropicon roscoffensis]|uniref:Ankyrin repeat protein n=1 Tax=Chloropicon roscoffensis TaxID=1461544 RepID=A0AAX4PF23_9CHLO
MDRGAAGEPTAKRAKKDKEDPLVRRRNELILEVANARVAMKAQGNKAVREATESLMQDLRGACADIEAENLNELLRKLPPELWEKIIDDENVQQNDVVALASTCRFFREKQKVLGRKLETDLSEDHFLKLLKTGKMASHSFGWFRWVSDTFEIRPGFTEWRKTAKGAMYEGDLLNYAAFQGSVEILRWLHEEKGWELSDGDGDTGWCAGRSGSVQVLEYLKVKGYKFDDGPCQGAARGGHLNVLKWCRSQTPPCPWDEETCAMAASWGHLEVLKWLRAQDPPCPWDEDTPGNAARAGHLEVLEWTRDQNPPCPWIMTCTDAAAGGQLEVLQWLRAQDPPCPWDEETCAWAAREGHLDILKWLRSQDPPCPWSESICSRAAEGGHLEVLNWLRSEDPPYPLSETTCSRAAGGGQLEALKYLRGLDPPCPWDKKTCYAAARGGHLDVLKFLRSQDPPCPWSEGTCAKAAQGGHLEVLKWARSQTPPCPWNSRTCAEAVGWGQLEVLKWLRAQDPPCPWRRRKCRKRALDGGSRRQHIVDWIDQQED